GARLGPGERNVAEQAARTALRLTAKSDVELHDVVEEGSSPAQSDLRSSSEGGVLDSRPELKALIGIEMTAGGEYDPTLDIVDPAEVAVARPDAGREASVAGIPRHRAPQLDGLVAIGLDEKRPVEVLPRVRPAVPVAPFDIVAAIPIPRVVIRIEA